MIRISDMSKEELARRLEGVKEDLLAWRERGLSLDLTRGKPGREQLDISLGMLDTINSENNCLTECGVDCRNYGGLDGIPEAKELFSALLGIPTSRIWVAGNSSLNLMFDAVSRAMLFGVCGGEEPWGRQGKIKFLCPSPGYDRHFAICETMGIELIPIEMSAEGPDMDKVEELVGSDSSIKGIWCVPKFSNPQGYTYSDETVRRFAKMKTAAPDFRIFWDNAYAVHEIYDEEVDLLDIFAESEKHGTADRIFYFASTSKISFPGSGVAIMAATEANLKQILPILGVQTIGHDKINQLRHVKYFKDAEGVKTHMRRHAEIIRPRFEAVYKAFRENLEGVATWTEPKGGYFVDLCVEDGCAKRVFELCAENGVKLTNVGASFPYGNDPRDRHLRIAPTFPEYGELCDALEILSRCVVQATIEKALA